MHPTCARSVGWPGRVCGAAMLLAAAIAAPANALLITPDFDSSITGSANAVAIEGAIDSAIGTIDSLYANPLSITVEFSYTAAAAGNLLSTTQSYYDESYAAYVAALQADAAANPQNTVLATALANLASGNNANGTADMALTGAQASMLGLLALSPTATDATININSTQPFAFSRPVSSGAYDLIGGLEHELNEVLGGGGGSTLNAIQQGNAWFTGKFGALDLYRYSAPGTPSFSPSGSVIAYLSVDGGRVAIAGLNQESGGDYGDFTPNCGGASGQLIQNAFNCPGAYEAYNATSPEFAMLEAIGYDSVVAEPRSAWLFAPAVLALGRLRRRANTARAGPRQSPA